LLGFSFVFTGWDEQDGRGSFEVLHASVGGVPVQQQGPERDMFVLEPALGEAGVRGGPERHLRDLPARLGDMAGPPLQAVEQAGSALDIDPGGTNK
jgi:hypothetical protein